MSTLFARLGAHFELSDHNRRVSSMEGMRGLAILLVFVCHYNGIIGEQMDLPAAVASASTVVGLWGASGVDLFFLLSGFLIYRSALRPGLNYFAFLHRRLERIYPTFLVVFAMYVALVGMHLAPSRIPAGTASAARYIVENLLFLPGVFDIRAFIGAAWSLSYEWFFYLAIPLIVHALQLHRWPRPRRMALFAAGVCGYVAVVLAFGNRFPVYQWYDSTHVRMIMFASGVLVYEALDSESIRSIFTRRHDYALTAIAALSAIVILVMCALKSSAGAVDGEWTASTGVLQVVPTFTGCVALALVTLRPGGLLAGILSTNWLRWTGNISYSFYLVHSIPMHIVAVLTSHGPLLRINPLMTYVAALPVTIVFVYACAAILFICVERPLSLRPRRAPKELQSQLQAA